MEEKRPMDPTRRLLRVFGVTVTEYEERTAALLERAAAATERDEMLHEVTNHVVETQARVMTELRTVIDAKRMERP
jgi:hypothetical protein